MKATLIGCLAIIALMALSWLISVGIVWLICLCFSLKFSLLVATGVWIIWWALKGFFGSKG
jgi:hypothetical protein